MHFSANELKITVREPGHFYASYYNSDVAEMKITAEQAFLPHYVQGTLNSRENMKFCILRSLSASLHAKIKILRIWKY